MIGRRVTSARVDTAHAHRPSTNVVEEEYRLGRRWVRVTCIDPDCGLVLAWRQG